MNRITLTLKRPFIWLSRFRHRCGYGVHSPFAFNLITQVIYESTPYYKYRDLAIEQKKLAPQKEAIAKVPWNTIIMIAGAGMLIAVAVEAGTIEALSTWIGSNVPKPLVPIAFCLVGAIMSFFSSTTGVVAPALFPLIPNLAASVGLSAPVLFACTILGAQSSAISPFSSGGSLILGSTPKEEERNELFNRLLMVAVPISVITCTIYNFVIAMVL